MGMFIGGNLGANNSWNAYNYNKAVVKPKVVLKTTVKAAETVNIKTTENGPKVDPEVLTESDLKAPKWWKKLWNGVGKIFENPIVSGLAGLLLPKWANSIIKGGIRLWGSDTEGLQTTAKAPSVAPENIAVTKNKVFYA